MMPLCNRFLYQDYQFDIFPEKSVNLIGTISRELRQKEDSHGG